MPELFRELPLSNPVIVYVRRNRSRRRQRPRRKRARRLARLSDLQLKSRPALPQRRNAELLNLLRRVAREGRSDRVQSFYSIRQVAERFQVSPTTVSRIFDQLKTEGVIRSVWGSKTTLEAERLDRQLRIRGVVALLVSAESLIRNHGGQRFIEKLSHELWKLEFASRVWSYEASEAEQASLIESLIAEKPDAIVWLTSTRRATGLAHRLSDCGIRVIRVADSQSIQLVTSVLAFHLENRAPNYPKR